MSKSGQTLMILSENIGIKLYLMPATADNSVFVARYAHANAFGTSQTRKPLAEIGHQKEELTWKELKALLYK